MHPRTMKILDEGRQHGSRQTGCPFVFDTSVVRDRTTYVARQYDTSKPQLVTRLIKFWSIEPRTWRAHTLGRAVSCKICSIKTAARSPPIRVPSFEYGISRPLFYILDFFCVWILSHFLQFFPESPTTSNFVIPRFPTVACKDSSKI